MGWNTFLENIFKRNYKTCKGLYTLKNWMNIQILAHNNGSLFLFSIKTNAMILTASGFSKPIDMFISQLMAIFSEPFIAEFYEAYFKEKNNPNLIRHVY